MFRYEQYKMGGIKKMNKKQTGIILTRMNIIAAIGACTWTIIWAETFMPFPFMLWNI